jgi:hypothetical protein
VLLPPCFAGNDPCGFPDFRQDKTDRIIDLAHKRSANHFHADAGGGNIGPAEMTAADFSLMDKLLRVFSEYQDRSVCRHSIFEQMKFFEDAGNGCACVGIVAAFVFCLCKKIVNNGSIDIVNRCVRANLPISRWLVDGEDHSFQFIGGHDPVLGSRPHVRDAVKEVRFAGSLRDRDNNQVFSRSSMTWISGVISGLIREVICWESLRNE